jgi:hypothetical protein
MIGGCRKGGTLYALAEYGDFFNCIIELFAQEKDHYFGLGYTIWKATELRVPQKYNSLHGK